MTLFYLEWSKYSIFHKTFYVIRMPVKIYLMHFKVQEASLLLSKCDEVDDIKKLFIFRHDFIIHYY